jgi:hypothetical protein
MSSGVCKRSRNLTALVWSVLTLLAYILMNWTLKEGVMNTSRVGIALKHFVLRFF